MGIMAKRLGWILAPMLVFGVVSLKAADNRTAAKAAAASRTTILGAAWHSDNSPIKRANLRLRNVVSGKIESVARANEAGQFTFENIEGGSYVVELVTDSGHILTVGDVFTIAPGETVATFVRLGPKTPWGTAVFNAAGDIASTAATEGIAAIKSTAAAQGIVGITATGTCQSPPCH
jgi:hypothetical protein